MHIIRLNCDACGAPLQVPAKANFVTCTFCSAQLAIRRTEGAITTEALEAIAEETRKMAEGVETIKLQNDLERLDREWTMGLERYRMRNRNGHYAVPSSAGAIAWGLMAMVSGVVWMVFTSSRGAPWPFPLFGLFFIGTGVVGTVIGCWKAGHYEQARQAYERRRHAVLRDMQARSTTTLEDSGPAAA